MHVNGEFELPDLVIYIGAQTEHGGCTGNAGFHAALAEQWELTASYDARVYVRRVSHKRHVLITSAR